MDYGFGRGQGAIDEVTEGQNGALTVTVPDELPLCALLVSGLTSHPEPTCSAVDFQGFDMVLERRFDHQDGRGTNYLSAPIAFPEAGTVYVATGAKHSEDADDSLDVLLIDGKTGEAADVVGLPDGEPQHLAASRSLRPNADPGGWELHEHSSGIVWEPRILPTRRLGGATREVRRSPP